MTSSRTLPWDLAPDDGSDKLREECGIFGVIGARDAAPIVVRRELAWYDCTFIPVTDDDAVASLESPIGHSDPFDEILLVQAQQRDLRLLTRDSRLVEHPIALAG